MRWTRQRRRARRSQGESLVSDRPARRRTALKRTAKACGSGTRCWCQVGGGFCGPNRAQQTFNPPMTVTTRIRRRGERAISRKTIAQGMPDASAEPVCSCALSFVHFCTRDRGCSAHPAFPCSLSGAVRATPRTHRAARRRTRIRCLKFESEIDASAPCDWRTDQQRHCERSEAIHLSAQRKNGLLPPSLVELRRTSRRGVYHRAGQRPDPLAPRNDAEGNYSFSRPAGAGWPWPCCCLSCSLARWRP